ncbi:MAG: CHAT domain-containing protein [Myxococcales bacterium]|nr:CHAT domain-containing protein [Myxococcales bacterium]
MSSFISSSGYCFLSFLLNVPSIGGEISFAACEEKVARAPESYEAYLCYFRVASESERLRRQAKERLVHLGKQYPQIPWLTMVVGMLAVDLHDPEASEYYQRAAALFQDQGISRGEVIARVNLALGWLENGRMVEADHEISRVETIADREGDPELRVRAALSRVMFIQGTGGDLWRALAILKGVQAYDPIPSGLKQHVLWLLGDIAHALGQYDLALLRYEELEELLETTKDAWSLAKTRYNIVSSLLEQRLDLPHPRDRRQVLKAAKRALHTAVAAGEPGTEAASRSLIAHLIANEPSQGDEAVSLLRQCIVAAEVANRLEYQVQCRWQLSALLFSSDPVQANALMRGTIPLLEKLASPEFVAWAWRERTRAQFRTGATTQGIADGLRALDAIENYRERQVSQEGRVRFMARWAGDYYRLSGELLRLYEQEGSRPDLEQAFTITERLRARVLLEHIADLRPFSSLEVGQAMVDRRREVLALITGIHRRLLRPHLLPSDRASLLDALHDAEAEDSRLRDQMAPPASALERSASQAFIGLDEVQQLLQPDEALLSFQIGVWDDLFGEFGGGAWLLTVTREEVGLVKIWDRVKLEAVIPVFAGMFADRRGPAVASAKTLYKELLKGSVERLPSEISRLVIVPDGRLNQLPFEALLDAEGVPLGQSYRLSVVPSATIWEALRRAPRSSASKTVLALADPLVHHSGVKARRSDKRPGMEHIFEQIEPLPHARTESRRVIRTIGGESRLLVGTEASERALKTARPDQYRVLHLATHAVSDNRHPQRSAVVLAPGSSEEDGLLQFWEIGNLDLRNQVVVLSGCRTASGKLLRGEGVLGLARAFLVAGAVAVVGSLWPVRDDDAKQFFEVFYVNLSRGASVDYAAQRARVAAIQRGAPAVAWAGLVVLGDGSVVPFPGGSPAHWMIWWYSSLVIGAILLGLVALRYQRSARPPDLLTPRGQPWSEGESRTPR